jgi:hypothetical protein
MEEKIFFLPGDVVTIRQERLENRPTMLVVKKVKKTIRLTDSKTDHLQGILCRWFTKDFTLQEHIFNTKDLIKIQ